MKTNKFYYFSYTLYYVLYMKVQSESGFMSARALPSGFATP